MTLTGEYRAGDAEETRSALELAGVLARRWRLLIGLPLLVGLSAGLFSLVLPKRYTVESRFTPESSEPNVSRLAGLAAQFGVDIGGASEGESIDFYAELLESRDLLRSVVLTEFRFPVDAAESDSTGGTLIDLFEAKGKTQAERELHAVEKLEELVTTRTDPAANMVTLRTSAPWPALAVAINARLLELLNEFNLERRQSRAAAERQFLETRVAGAAVEMRDAEAQLERFLSENRRYDESPQLRFEVARLERRVDLLQQIHTSLTQGYEQARVDEVRNTPVITVIDQARGPAEKTAPNLAVNIALGMILGALLALGVVVVGEILDTSRLRQPFGLLRGDSAS